MKIIISLTMAILATTAMFVAVNSHGMMLDPPNRSSLWRFPEFLEFNPPVNYEDNENFCGGVAAQHGQNEGKCGECGDNWAHAKPRENENRGYYGRGVIARRYTPGQVVDVLVELTASHFGYFEFRLCEHNNLYEPETQECFNEHLLEMADGSGTRFMIDDVVGFTRPRIRLPANVRCSQCVLQWHYQTGNSWGDCGNGTEAIGCGPQETFRNCADIQIM